MATKVEELRQASSAAWDEFSAEMAKYSDENLPTAEQATHIDELRTRATLAQKELNQAEEFSRAHADWERQSAEMSRSVGRPPSESGDVLRRRGLQSLGTRLVALPEYQAWLRAVAPNGNIPNRTVVQSPPLTFGGLREFGMMAELITGAGDTSGGALIIPDQYGPITEFGRRPLTIRDVITNLTTTSDVVEFVRQTGETNNAAVVPESNVTDAEESGGEPGIKPESGMTFERVPAPVKTIAHWLPATTRALADAGQLRGLIDAFLRFGVELELEDQIISGDGNGENFDGILSTANVQQQLFVDDIFKTARQARRKVRTVGRRRPSAYVLNPIDWEEIELQKDLEGRYYFNGPINQGPMTLWGLPVVESEAVPEGTGLVADWSVAVLWDREQASISVSNSHADFFIRNMVAILCELRAAFGVLKPDAIVAFDTQAS